MILHFQLIGWPRRLYHLLDVPFVPFLHLFHDPVLPRSDVPLVPLLRIRLLPALNMIQTFHLIRLHHDPDVPVKPDNPALPDDPDDPFHLMIQMFTTCLYH
jgi:hypothetical protein